MMRQQQVSLVATLSLLLCFFFSQVAAEGDDQYHHRHHAKNKAAPHPSDPAFDHYSRVVESKKKKNSHHHQQQRFHLRSWKSKSAKVVGGDVAVTTGQHTQNKLPHEVFGKGTSGGFYLDPLPSKAYLSSTLSRLSTKHHDHEERVGGEAARRMHKVQSSSATGLVKDTILSMLYPVEDMIAVAEEDLIFLVNGSSLQADFQCTAGTAGNKKSHTITFRYNNILTPGEIIEQVLPVEGGGEGSSSSFTWTPPAGNHDYHVWFQVVCAEEQSSPSSQQWTSKKRIISVKDKTYPNGVAILTPAPFTTGVLNEKQHLRVDLLVPAASTGISFTRIQLRQGTWLSPVTAGSSLLKEWSVDFSAEHSSLSLDVGDIIPFTASSDEKAPLFFLRIEDNSPICQASRKMGLWVGCPASEWFFLKSQVAKLSTTFQPWKDIFKWNCAEGCSSAPSASVCTTCREISSAESKKEGSSSVWGVSASAEVETSLSIHFAAYWWDTSLNYALGLDAAVESKATIGMNFFGEVEKNWTVPVTAPSFSVFESLPFLADLGLDVDATSLLVGLKGQLSAAGQIQFHAAPEFSFLESNFVPHSHTGIKVKSNTARPVAVIPSMRGQMDATVFAGPVPSVSFKMGTYGVSSSVKTLAGADMSLKYPAFKALKKGSDVGDTTPKGDATADMICSSHDHYLQTKQFTETTTSYEINVPFLGVRRSTSFKRTNADLKCYFGEKQSFFQALSSMVNVTAVTSNPLVKSALVKFRSLVADRLGIPLGSVLMVEKQGNIVQNCVRLAGLSEESCTTVYEVLILPDLTSKNLQGGTGDGVKTATSSPTTTAAITNASVDTTLGAVVSLMNTAGSTSGSGRIQFSTFDNKDSQHEKEETSISVAIFVLIALLSFAFLVVAVSAISRFVSRRRRNPSSSLVKSCDEQPEKGASTKKGKKKNTASSARSAPGSAHLLPGLLQQHLLQMSDVEEINLENQQQQHEMDSATTSSPQVSTCPAQSTNGDDTERSAAAVRRAQFL